MFCWMWKLTSKCSQICFEPKCWLIFFVCSILLLLLHVNLNRCVLSAYSLNKTVKTVWNFSEWICKIGISNDHVLKEFRFHTGDQIYRQTADTKEDRSVYSRIPPVWKEMEEESTPYGGEFSEGAPWKGNLRSLWNGQEPEKGHHIRGRAWKWVWEQFLQVEGFLLILYIYLSLTRAKESAKDFRVCVKSWKDNWEFGISAQQ